MSALAVLACALASLATSAPMVTYPRAFPGWTLQPSTPLHGAGIRARVWVSKSGKTGVGLTLRLFNCGATPRVVTLERVELHVDGSGDRFGAILPGPVTAPPSKPVHLYLPVAFDNERLWNQGHRRGVLSVRLRVGRQALTWRLAAGHSRKDYHRAVHVRGKKPGPPACRDAADLARQERCPATSPGPGNVIEDPPTTQGAAP